VSSLPGLGLPAASGLNGDGGVVDGAREVTPQPEVGLPAAAGARNDGGGSPEWTQWRRAVATALEALS
jgi:hypothetical protein